jgi:Fe-S-cluster containining protein
MQDVRVSELLAFKELLQDLQQIFACRRCGRCCNEFRGVKVTRADIERIGVSPPEWSSRFKIIDGEYVLEQPCYYYDAKKSACSIYENRPEICRKYPVNNKLLDDGHHHLGVSSKCQAAVEALESLEAEFLDQSSDKG